MPQEPPSPRARPSAESRSRPPSRRSADDRSGAHPDLTSHATPCSELEERTGRSDDECDAADGRGDDARLSLTRSIEKALYGARTLAPDKVIELVDDHSAHRIGIEDETGDPSGD